MGFGSIFNRKKKRRSTNSTSSSPDGPSNESLFIQSHMRSSLENFTQTQLREIEEVFKKFDVNGVGARFHLESKDKGKAVAKQTRKSHGRESIFGC
ncbi:hypothetical protein GQ457_13G017110 [Hibiscus cannabinus]